jgi:hypothetical protein
MTDVEYEGCPGGLGQFVEYTERKDWTMEPTDDVSQCYSLNRIPSYC